MISRYSYLIAILMNRILLFYNINEILKCFTCIRYIIHTQTLLYDKHANTLAGHRTLQLLQTGFL